MLLSTSVLGLTTNRRFLKWLVNDRDVGKGSMWTTLIDEQWPGIAAAAPNYPSRIVVRGRVRTDTADRCGVNGASGFSALTRPR